MRGYCIRLRMIFRLRRSSSVAFVPVHVCSNAYVTITITLPCTFTCTLTLTFTCLLRSLLYELSNKSEIKMIRDPDDTYNEIPCCVFKGEHRGKENEKGVM